MMIYVNKSINMQPRWDLLYDAYNSESSNKKGDEWNMDEGKIHKILEEAFQTTIALYEVTFVNVFYNSL